MVRLFNNIYHFRKTRTTKHSPLHTAPPIIAYGDANPCIVGAGLAPALDPWVDRGGVGWHLPLPSMWCEASYSPFSPRCGRSIAINVTVSHALRIPVNISRIVAPPITYNTGTG